MGVDAPSFVRSGLINMGLLASGAAFDAAPLTGGVSSDVWKVQLPDGRTVCIKQALPQLKVAAHWEAPVERGRYEIAWLQTARAIVPHAVPEVLGADPATGSFAMAFLPPEDHPVWKDQLMAGFVDIDVAAGLAEHLAAIHGATAGRADIEAAFPTTPFFDALRVDPFLRATAAKHPDLADILHAMAARLLAARTALVHGDISPKNILVGPKGPVIIDAECAWYGDPVFDLAFCLNHLLLKCLARPDRAPEILSAFVTLWQTYALRVSWEDWPVMEERLVPLLMALLLARVDGKSPAGYLTEKWQHDAMRLMAHAVLRAPDTPLGEIPGAWLRLISAAAP